MEHGAIDYAWRPQSGEFDVVPQTHPARILCIGRKVDISIGAGGLA